MKMLAWNFLLLLLPFLRTRQLIEELNHRPGRSARHPTLRQIRIQLILTLHTHAGNIEMDPINAIDELIQESGCFTRTTMTVALIVHIVRPVFGDLFGEELPQRHPPHPIAGNHAGLTDLRPQRLRIAENTTGRRAQGRTDAWRQCGHI